MSELEIAEIKASRLSRIEILGMHIMRESFFFSVMDG